MCFCDTVTVVDGVPLPEGRWRIIGSGNLQLSSVVASDTAMYVCTLYEASLTAAASLVVYGMHLLAVVVMYFLISVLFLSNVLLGLTIVLHSNTLGLLLIFTVIFL